jgi:hypothetical protein
MTDGTDGLHEFITTHARTELGDMVGMRCSAVSAICATLSAAHLAADAGDLHRVVELLGMAGARADLERHAAVRHVPARRCAECGENWADLPSSLCPGCEAYRAHQR